MTFKSAYKYDLTQRFLENEKHPLYGKVFKRLTQSEKAECIAFILDLESKDYNQAHQIINRWGLGEAKRPTNFSDMHYLVCVTAPRIMTRRQNGIA